MQKFVNTGVSGLDEILYGGIPQGNTVIIEGFPGTGKTILGMQFLYYGAVAYNEPGIYITFEEFPDQIYKDMKSFGWDIKKLEQENKIRVITLSPEVLMDQIIKPDGLFDRLVNEIGCKRIVIDSISLFQYYYETKEEQRKIIYSLRNVLRKYQLTSCLLKEETAVEEDQVSFINYLVDGVINLKLQSHLEHYRKRTLEVTKMRGNRIQEGEHTYRITNQGIQLIPALTMVEDKMITYPDTIVPTGLQRLDQIIDGGINDGASFVIDTNSKANYRYLIGSMLAKRIIAGENIIVLLSNLSTIDELNFTLNSYDLCLEQLIADKRIYFIEHFKRPVPSYAHGSVIDVALLDNEQFNQLLRDELSPIINEQVDQGKKWFLYYDLNTIVSVRGAEFLKRFYAEEVAQLSSEAMSMLALTNFKELGIETASFIERSSNGVIKTWVDGMYQYIQVTKSPNGRNSEPMIVEKIDEKPFIRLV